MGDPSTADLYQRACEHVRRANFPAYEKTDFLVGYLDRLRNACAQHNLRPPDHAIETELARIADNLYKAEELWRVPEPTAPARTIEDGRYRDRLLLIIARASEPAKTLELLYRALIQMGMGFTQHLQTYAVETPSFGSHTVELIDLLEKPLEAIYHFYMPLFSKEANDLGLFRVVVETIGTNLVAIKERYPKFKKVYPTPENYGADPRECIRAFLRGTPLERIFFTNITIEQPEFSIPIETRFSGHWVIAPPGRGKTNFLLGSILEDMTRDASIIVMDSKGDLINPIRKIKAVADRFVIIEPDDEHPLALNPLDIPKSSVVHTIALLEYVFSSLLEAKMTALQSTLFRNVLPAIVQTIPNATMMTFRDIIENGFDHYRANFAALKPLDRRFFDEQFNTKTYADTRNQLIWRLDFLMTNPLMRAMFEAPKTKIDIGQEMNAGKIILINNSKELLGEEGAEFFGRFFISLVLAAAQQRSSRRMEDKLPCFFYIDECQNVIKRDTKIATILDECRSQRIGLILAHQRTEQIKDRDVLSALFNCAIRFANSDDEAKLLSDSLRTTPEFLRSLPRGTFAAYVRDLTPNAIALPIPYFDLSEFDQLSDQEQVALRDRMRKQFCFVPEPINSAPNAPESPPAERPSVPTVSTTQQPSPSAKPKSTPGVTQDAGDLATKW